MANTYNWKINQLDAKIKDGNLENVIYNVHWRYYASDGEVEPITATRIGVLNVKYKEGEPFIPYSDLTKDNVIAWLESGIDVDELKKALDKDIELKKNPVDETLYPDWDSE
jgi:hypothetical protein